MSPEKQSPTIDTGGLAFPTQDIYHPNGEIEYGSTGMTLRDWFAGKAMQQFVDQRDHQIWLHDDIAKAAYIIADAMISARKGDAQ